VIGVPDEHYGEEVAAIIAARPGSELDAAEVSRWARERLSACKIPRIVRFVDALPKGPSGKILKRSIHRTALARDTSAADAAARRPWASAGS
jgi:acyl-CoA synthetase (AMP-forming)/AMP-acid ligase II